MSGARPAAGFNGMTVLDGFAVFANVAHPGQRAGRMALAYNYLKRDEPRTRRILRLDAILDRGDDAAGQAYDLIIVFLAIELLSIPLYVMAGLARPRLDSEESALKYFLLGTFSSAFLLYGIA